MKTPNKPELTKDIKPKINQILSLYSNASLSEMLNDLVAVGTWPTPEKPVVGKDKVGTKTGGSVAIDTVPLPERPKKLKGLLDELSKIVGDRKMEDQTDGKLVSLLQISGDADNKSYKVPAFLNEIFVIRVIYSVPSILSIIVALACLIFK